MPRKKKHRAIDVGKDAYVSLCETCKHMPEGTVPRNNTEIRNGSPAIPFMLCLKKAFAPIVEYDNQGKAFYDVAECDGYEDFYKKDTGTTTPKRAKT